MPKTTKKAGARAVAKTKTKKKRVSESAQKKPARKGLRIEIWAGLLLFMSFVAFLTFFNVKGFLINWYRWLTCALFGYGFYLMPFCLLIAGIYLLLRKRSYSRLQLACILIFPMFIGCIRHLITDNNVYPFNVQSFKTLVERGQEFTSGGIVSGWIAVLFRSAIGQVGAVILLTVLAVVCLFLAISPNLSRISQSIRRRMEEQRTDWDVSDEPATLETLKPRDTPRPQRRGKPVIDLPIDDVGSYPVNGGAFDFDAHEPIEEIPMINELRQRKPKSEKKPKPAPETVAEPISETAEPDKQDGPSVEEILEKAAADPLKSYVYPPVTLLNPPSLSSVNAAQEKEKYSRLLVDTLQSFNIEAQVIGITRGPTVTRYELTLSRGTKYARVVNLADDIALALGASGVRISMIPDKNAIGIEVPNDHQQTVVLRELIEDPSFRNHKSNLSFCVGRDIAGKCVVGDLSSLPHLLVAGTTGSGKSVCINSIILSLVYKSSPQDVRLIMVDPKMIELGVYNGIPHLMIPVVTDPKKAAGALNWAVGEMMKRYKLFSEVNARNLDGYNAVAEARGEEKIPRVVVIIDELADLMAVARHEVEETIIRLAQMARAAGMHIIIATQRPSADVITGLMKTNIPSRIAFAVSSATDSRIILDTMGAEKLVGKGDMLYSPLGSNKPSRIQGAFVSTEEVEKVVAFLKQTGEAAYDNNATEFIEEQGKDKSSASGGGDVGDDEDDEKLIEAIGIVVESGQASTSMLQRRLKLGYARAARLVDQMEERGIVGPFEGSKPRQVLITKDEWQEMLLRREM